MKKFIIKKFDDYHDIYDARDHAKGKKYKVLEIGCFPISGAGYCQYFACFYQGKKPTLKAVYERLMKKIAVGDFYHYRTGENIGFSPEDVRMELKGNKFK